MQMLGESFICHHQGRVGSVVIDPGLVNEQALTDIAQSLEKQNTQYRYLFIAFYTDLTAAQLSVKSHRTTAESGYEYAHRPAVYVKNDWTSHNEVIWALPGSAEKIIPLHPEIEPTGGLYYTPCNAKD